MILSFLVLTTLTAMPARAAPPGESVLNPLGCVQRLIGRIQNASGRAHFVDVTSRKIEAAAAERVTQELDGILTEVLPGGAGATEKMTAAQFRAAVAKLKEFAGRYGITVSEGSGMTGVYPKGLNQIELVFGDVGVAGPDFALRHELAHMFHTLQTRAILLDSVKAGTLSAEDAAAYLKLLESGANYREFEKAVTSTSSLASALSGREGVGRYSERVRNILDGTGQGLQAGRIRFPNGMGFEDVYGLFLSKAPLVVGTSGKSLAARMPAIWFATFYSLNLDVEAFGIDPAKAGVPGKRGFRDFVNALIAKHARLE